MLLDRRIIVTGGTSGIGKQVVIQAAQAGADVAFCGLTDEGADEVARAVDAAGRHSYFEAFDIADLERVRQFATRSIDALGGLDGLVNNAGTNFHHGVEKVTMEQIDRCFQVNFYSAVVLAQSVYPALKDARHAAVINMSSIHAFQTMPGAFPYNASKAALSALTKSIALDWAKEGIRSVAVAPGWVLTPLNERDFHKTVDPEAERQRVEEAHVLGRMARPEDIASFVIYALSEKNKALNGNTVILDGAMHTLAFPH